MRFSMNPNRQARWRLVTLLAMAAALLLSGCATMSPQECMTANWSQRGYQDGRAGFTSNRLAQHYKACSKVGVVPDTRAYHQGYDDGLRQYCTPDNAVQQGLDGKPYRGVCPPQTESEFKYYYNQGKRVYDAGEQVDRLVRESQRLERQLDDAHDRRERRQLRNALRDLDEDLRRARDDVTHEQRQLDRMWR